MALPALATLAADPLVSLVDTAIVARLGTAELGALGVNAGVFGFAFVVFNFLAYGTTPLVATAVAQGKRRDAGRLVVSSLALGLCIGLIGSVVLVGAATPIATLMGADAELIGPTVEYLRIRALAAPAVLAITAGNGAFRGYSDTRTPLWLTLGLSLVNLIGDIVLVLGFGWGIAGAAWATVFAQYLGAAGFLVALLGHRRHALGLVLEWPQWVSMRRLIGVGSVMSIRTFALVGTLTFGTSLATRMGPVTIAAHQIATQLWLLFALFIDALALSGQILVADHMGRHRPDLARAVSSRLLVFGSLFGVIFAGVVLVGGPFWPWFFDLEPDVTLALGSVLWIVALMQPLNAAVFVGDGVFMGARAFGWLAGVMVFTAVCTGTAFAVTWVGEYGLVGLWWSMVVMILARALGLGARWWGPWAILTDSPPRDSAG
ncbi:MAG: MATE family multidrug resistance protein [Myxococcota bacterium]|jgi:MATE family multidrug resistance protein